ncbi:hypothetical protein [Afifella sp. IM 167]|uniref:hypothetical protein n=1 Tax=Afifella sp. IM 167 TaxID=2033586 RepID=UPI001CC94CBE|nr:hypothetical protein [Afifella sp. IM 167]MBZ8132693.1 hypothetical protein [Afifella sp. IM 167]
MESYAKWFSDGFNALVEKKDEEALRKVGKAMKEVGLTFKQAGVNVPGVRADCSSDSGGGGDCSDNSCLVNSGGGDCGNESCLNASDGGSCGSDVCSSCASSV